MVCCVSVLLFCSGNDRKENGFPEFCSDTEQNKKTPCRSTGGRAEFAEAPIQLGDRRGLQIISRRGLDVPRPAPTAETVRDYQR